MGRRFGSTGEKEAPHLRADQGVPKGHLKKVALTSASAELPCRRQIHKWPRRRANAPGPGTEDVAFDASETVLAVAPLGAASLALFGALPERRARGDGRRRALFATWRIYHPEAPVGVEHHTARTALRRRVSSPGVPTARRLPDQERWHSPFRYATLHAQTRLPGSPAVRSVCGFHSCFDRRRLPRFGSRDLGVSPLGRSAASRPLSVRAASPKTTRDCPLAVLP